MALTDRELKAKVLQQIWGFASVFHEGHDEGMLSDFYVQEVERGHLTEQEAFRAQKIMKEEADILHRKLQRFKKNK